MRDADGVAWDMEREIGLWGEYSGGKGVCVVPLYGTIMGGLYSVVAVVQ